MSCMCVRKENEQAIGVLHATKWIRESQKSGNKKLDQNLITHVVFTMQRQGLSLKQGNSRMVIRVLPAYPKRTHLS